MGLNTNTQNISYTLNKTQQAKEERQKQKRLSYELKNEIEGLLLSGFNILYIKNKKGYEAAIYNKDAIIENIIDNIDKKNYIKYLDIEFVDNSDTLISYISEQLDKNYIKYLQQFDKIYKLQKQYEREEEREQQKAEREKAQKEKEQQKESTAELLEKLENKLNYFFEYNKNMILSCNNVLQQKENVSLIIEDITKDAEHQKILYDNYFRVFQKVQKFYLQEIKTEKENRKNQIAIIKQNQKNKLIRRAGYVASLHMISSIIPKAKKK